MRIIGIVTLHGILFAYAQVLQIFGGKHHTSCTSWGEQDNRERKIKLWNQWLSLEALETPDQTKPYTAGTF